jgi:hypothetical protein
MRWLHSIGSGLVLIVTLLAPSIQVFISAHPAAVVALGTVYGILGSLLPSPLSAPGPASPESVTGVKGGV